MVKRFDVRLDTLYLTQSGDDCQPDQVCNLIMLNGDDETTVHHPPTFIKVDQHVSG